MWLTAGRLRALALVIVAAFTMVGTVLATDARAGTATPDPVPVPESTQVGGRVPAVEPSATRRVEHRVPVRHRVTYQVRTRGRITASVATFKRQTQATFDARRGWRSAGVSFRRVARGGDFTLVLSEASRVPSFSSGCSAQWSCRVGRFVIINQTRWQRATPMWKDRGRSRRAYRHMVVNHETGHWLGHGHRGCTGRGNRAPVMQQQSIDLDGCRPNPWPTAPERRLPRFD
jgi:Protein of unknown function (DUF3152)